MKSFFLFLFIIVAFACTAQDRPGEWYPPRNKQCPVFNISNVKHYKKKSITNSDFKGKWVVLDFWNSHCGACVGSFPRMDSMSRKFSGRVDFFLVGIGCDNPPIGEDEKLDSIYESRRKLYNLSIPFAAALDLGKKWNLCTAPDIVVIDDKGIVRVHTYHITASQVDSLINGQSPHFEKFPGEIEYQ
jgi:thiol-disulfide isomerase/thioredoxin